MEGPHDAAGPANFIDKKANKDKGSGDEFIRY